MEINTRDFRISCPGFFLCGFPHGAKSRCGFGWIHDRTFSQTLPKRQAKYLAEIRSKLLAALGAEKLRACEGLLAGQLQKVEDMRRAAGIQTSLSPRKSLVNEVEYPAGMVQ